MNEMTGKNGRLTETICREFGCKKILVIGDLMVDEYIVGNVSRLSPEAPIPVLDSKKCSMEAGGASNVAHNLNSLGAEVLVAGTAADDEAGGWLRRHFMQLQIGTEGIIAECGRPTTVKTRYATKSQQLLRVDEEDTRSILEATQEKLFRYVEKNMEAMDAVVLSDYQKGVLENGIFVQRIIRMCQKYRVLVAVDSKSRRIRRFAGASFIKPNNLELEAAVNIRIVDDGSFEQAGRMYLKESGAEVLLVTRGSKGISVFWPGKARQDYPARDAQVYDVCGAGDTVISTVTLALVCGLSMGEAVRLANIAAGISISRTGTVVVTSEELMRSVYESEDCCIG